MDGKFNIPKDVGKRAGQLAFSDDGLAFLFAEMRYEDKRCGNPKTEFSRNTVESRGTVFAADDLHVLKNSDWNRGIASDDGGPIKNEMFSGCLSAQTLVFGFCRRILLD